ncbi:MAG TPA: hypothetical protein VKP65_24165, partial [Rhodothermales bacterium]|nr:hypothetical protein [Rhodothermales bacterium]
MRPTFHLIRFLMLALLIGLFRVNTAQAQVPGTIAYQGYLTDTSGDPLDGTVNLAFRLYDAPTGGTAAWAESQLNVPVSDGVFSVQLGRVESLSGVAFEQPLWLAVHVNEGNELSPRVALTAAPYALSTRGLRMIPGDGDDDAPSIIAGDASN